MPANSGHMSVADTTTLGVLLRMETRLHFETVHFHNVHFHHPSRVLRFLRLFRWTMRSLICCNWSIGEAGARCNKVHI
jgi:hypothetical protein